jgi:hypothetical protein
MENSDIFINLFYDVHEDSFKIKTNLKKEKINEILFECYRATLGQEPDYREFNRKKIYNIQISLDLPEDSFHISSNAGNHVLTYELIRASINNWDILPEEISIDKQDLEHIILKNRN